MEFLQKVIQLYAERKEWFLDLFAAHVGLALTAAVSAGIIGLLLGIFISEHKKAAGPVLTIANIGYTIPAISLLGMLIPVLGIGDKTAITALTIYGIMPMVRNTYAGITGVGEEVVAAAEGMGSTRFQIMTKNQTSTGSGSHHSRRKKYGRYDNLCVGDRVVYRSGRSWSSDLQRYYDL